MAVYLQPQAAREKSTQTDTGSSVSIPSRPPSTVPFLFEEAEKDLPPQTPAYLRYGRVALRLLVLVCSAAVIGVAANSLVSYDETKNYTMGANTQALSVEPTGDKSLWPSGTLLIPTDVLLLVASCSVLATLVIIPISCIKDYDGTPMIKDPMWIMPDGIYVLAWLVGVVVFEAVSKAVDDSLMKYACDNRNTLFANVGKYGSVCGQQVSNKDVSYSMSSAKDFHRMQHSVSPLSHS